VDLRSLEIRLDSTDHHQQQQQQQENDLLSFWKLLFIIISIAIENSGVFSRREKGTCFACTVVTAHADT
jgi:hypothetical protein